MTEQFPMVGRHAALVAAVLALASFHAMADSYRCTDSRGKPHLSDRPVTECQDVEQQVLNADGSVRRTIPPSMSPIEVERRKDEDRIKEIRRAEQLEEVRRDRNLMIRYPDAAAHGKARGIALDDARKSIDQSEKRLAALAAERKPLANEAEFYVGRPMPIALKQSLDANDAAVAAQRLSIANQEAEMARINASYDLELARLRRLWSGVAAGATGSPVAPGPAPAPVRRAASR